MAHVNLKSVMADAFFCSLQLPMSAFMLRSLALQSGKEGKGPVSKRGGGGGCGGEGERRDGVVCGGRLKECWLGCLQDGGH